MVLSRDLTAVVSPSLARSRTAEGSFSYVESECKSYRNTWELMAQLRLANSTDIKTAVRRHYPGFPAALWLHKKGCKEEGNKLFPVSSGSKA